MRSRFLIKYITTILFIFGSIVVVGICLGSTDIIYLKNGKQIKTKRSWIEGKQVKFLTKAGTMAIPLETVEKIEKSKDESSSGKSSTSQKTSNNETAQDSEAQIKAQLLKKYGKTTSSSTKGKIEKSEVPLKKDSQETSENSTLLIKRKMEVQNLIKQEKFTEAVKELRQIIVRYPQDIEAKVVLGALYLRMGNTSMAETQLREALLIEYYNADAHYLLGEVYYRQEKLIQAKREWQQSLQLRPNQELKRRLEQLEKEDELMAGYSKAGSARFNLRYYGEPNSNLGKAILSNLETMHTQLSRKLDYLPEETIVVILYSDQDFYDTTGAPRIIGGLYDGKVRIPIRGISSITPTVKNTLIHELTHAFLHHKTRGNCPRWLHEGLAQYMEGLSARAYNSQLALIVKNRGFPALPLYPSSLSMIEYMIDSYGMSDIHRILDSLGKGMSIDTAMKQYLHANYEEFQQEWAEKVLNVSL